jgi:hypothetical protein
MADAEATVEEPQYEEPAEAEVEVEPEEEFVAVGGATEVKLFGKWSFDDIEVRDISLVVSLISSFILVVSGGLVVLLRYRQPR